MKFKFIHLLFCLIIFGCSNQSKLDYALNLAGENRYELEKVLKYYKIRLEDSLKYKAAVFLIENMPGHYSFVGSSIDDYCQKVNMIIDSNLEDITKKRSIIELSKTFDQKNTSKCYDIETVKGDDLIKHIDYMVDLWLNGNHASHLSFQSFCEDLLPYRAMHEIIDMNIDSLKSMFEHKLQTEYDLIDEYSHSCYWATIYVNENIKQDLGCLYDQRIAPLGRLSTLARCRWGSCIEFAVLGVHIMRSKGIPSNIDYTLEYPFRDVTHYWNSVSSRSNKRFKYITGDVMPGERHLDDDIMAKVYRISYELNVESLEMLSVEEETPDIFRDVLHIKDVTNEYVYTSDVHIQIDEKYRKGKKILYLAVFNSGQWYPIDRTRIKNNKACFKNMGREVVYLPVYYHMQKIIPCGKPFLLDAKGSITHFDALSRQIDSAILTRKYPLSERIYSYVKESVGAKIEASNDPNFSNSIVAASIDKWQITPQTIPITLKSKYKYWRYLSAPDGYCSIGDISFINESQKAIIGEIISNESQETVYRAFDNDVLTYYRSKYPSEGWIGMKFAEPVIVSKIILTPRNDDNNIRINDRYELFYWDNDTWNTLGMQTASTNKLIYNNVPAGTLLLLKDHSRGNEERIFTYKNKKQIWW